MARSSIPIEITAAPLRTVRPLMLRSLYASPEKELLRLMKAGLVTRVATGTYTAKPDTVPPDQPWRPEFEEAAMAYATQAGQRYFDESSRRGGEARRPYVNAISMLRRTSGRSAQDFELNVEVLPLSQRGVWWKGSLTIAITDSVRSDVVAFDSALAAVVDELG